MSQIIKRFCNESIYKKYGHGLSNDQMNILWPAIVSIYLVGGTIGSLTGSWLADKVGRKGGLIGSAILAITAGVLFFGTKLANSVEMLIIARFVIGLASGEFLVHLIRASECSYIVDSTSNNTKTAVNHLVFDSNLTKTLLLKYMKGKCNFIVSEAAY